MAQPIKRRPEPIQFIANAFQYADEMMRADYREREELRRHLSVNRLTMPILIAYYVDCLADDRRYKVHFLAADTQFASAIVKYKGIKIDIYGKYDPISKRRYYTGKGA